MPVRRNEPFPAILRRVSGKKVIIAKTVTDESIRRKMKIDLKLSE